MCKTLPEAKSKGKVFFALRNLLNRLPLHWILNDICKDTFIVCYQVSMNAVVHSIFWSIR